MYVSTVSSIAKVLAEYPEIFGSNEESLNETAESYFEAMNDSSSQEEFKTNVIESIKDSLEDENKRYVKRTHYPIVESIVSFYGKSDVEVEDEVDDEVDEGSTVSLTTTESTTTSTRRQRMKDSDVKVYTKKFMDLFGETLKEYSKDEKFATSLIKFFYQKSKPQAYVIYNRIVKGTEQSDTKWKEVPTGDRTVFVEMVNFFVEEGLNNELTSVRAKSNTERAKTGRDFFRDDVRDQFPKKQGLKFMSWISEQWKDLSEEKQNEYNQQAADYNKEHGLGGTRSKGSGPKSLSEKTRVTAFDVYLDDMKKLYEEDSSIKKKLDSERKTLSKVFKKHNDERLLREVIRAQWDELEEAERKEYTDRAKDLREERSSDGSGSGETNDTVKTTRSIKGKSARVKVGGRRVPASSA